MDVRALIETLLAQGLELWPAGSQLRYRAATTRLTPTVLAQLKQDKADMLRT